MEGETRSIIPSICATDVEVRIAGHLFDVEYRPAAIWVETLIATRRQVSLLMGAITDRASSAKLTDLIVNGKIDNDEITKAVHSILCEISGRPWWEALNILDTAVTNWDSFVGGKVVLAGLDPFMLTFAAWLDAVWLIIRMEVEDPAQNRALVDRIRSKPVVDGQEPEMDEDLFNQALSETV